jgi:hypothetical protein
MPFPSPIFSKDGEFQGAVNILIDVTEPQQADDLRAQAERCRRLADQTGGEVAGILSRLAAKYEVKALAMDLIQRSFPTA